MNVCSIHTSTDLVPGPPRNLSVRLTYRPTPREPDEDEAFFTLEWRPPQYWPLDGLQFDVMSEVDCPSRRNDQVYIFRDTTVMEIDIRQGERVYVVNGRIPVYAMGCKIIFLVGSKPKCSEEAKIRASSVTTTSITLACNNLPNYTGPYCNAPPVQVPVFPSPVRNVTLMVIPEPDNRLLARVFWLPPKRTGSAGYIDAYYLFWGVVSLRETKLIAGFKTDLASTKVPGTQLSAELLLNISGFEPFETLGVVIQAAGPNQTVEKAFSTIHQSVNLVPSYYDLTPEHVVANNSTVYVIQTNHRDPQISKVKIDVFWRRPSLSLGLDVSSYHVTLQPQYIDDNYLSEKPGSEEDIDQMTKTRDFQTDHVSAETPESVNTVGRV
ncbi:hypothetical protein PoB_003040000 [Plakobranchus ocellatus]|uniref:Uncharacterized protein n=1 Tax=Plakobranchus ocellatus TaxID=259542 RepID=A0AAV4A6U0_9GAST|nr:hypothetical protein PoB_003040000 [Plakobranchus ocellatus]